MGDEVQGLNDDTEYVTSARYEGGDKPGLCPHCKEVVIPAGGSGRLVLRDEGAICPHCDRPMRSVLVGNDHLWL